HGRGLDGDVLLADDGAVVDGGVRAGIGLAVADGDGDGRTLRAEGHRVQARVGGRLGADLHTGPDDGAAADGDVGVGGPEVDLGGDPGHEAREHPGQLVDQPRDALYELIDVGGHLFGEALVGGLGRETDLTSLDRCPGEVDRDLLARDPDRRQAGEGTEDVEVVFGPEGGQELQLADDGVFRGEG